MKVGVLTAALQELTPREIRDPDPDRAVEDWAAFAREIGADFYGEDAYACVQTCNRLVH